MEVNIQSVHFDADIKLINFIKDKLGKLNQFYDSIVGSEVILRTEKSDTKENKIVEIKIMIPGKELFAKKQNKSFEAATDEAVEALRRQLVKHKGKVLA